MNENVSAVEQKRGQRKVRTGTVLSNKAEKTIVVQVSRKAPHPVYRKVVKMRDKFTAHDENKEAQVGDVVRIMETRPLSKTKRWRLVEVVSKNIDQVKVEVEA